jgi:hypothetical protein
MPKLADGIYTAYRYEKRTYEGKPKKDGLRIVAINET